MCVVYAKRCKKPKEKVEKKKYCGKCFFSEYIRSAQTHEQKRAHKHTTQSNSVKNSMTLCISNGMKLLPLMMILLLAMTVLLLYVLRVCVRVCYVGYQLLCFILVGGVCIVNDRGKPRIICERYKIGRFAFICDVFLCDVLVKIYCTIQLHGQLRRIGVYIILLFISPLSFCRDYYSRIKQKQQLQTI